MTIKWTKQDVLDKYQKALTQPINPMPAVDNQAVLQKLLTQQEQK